MDNPNALPAAPHPAVAALNRLSPKVKAALALGTAGLIAIVAASWLWSAQPADKVLFTNLSDRDGGAIIAQLAQMNIPYRHADGGTLMVPADKVHEARLKLASAGLPKGSLVGFELMENQKFGVTQFQEQVNYQRGLEGELARSMQSLAPVAAARVHLALPKQSGFLRDKQPPTASVVLQLHAGRSLDRHQIAGIVHLVSASVPELNPKNVSVVDQYGSLLSSANQSGSAGLDAAQLDYVAQIEAATIRRIHDILEPIVGRENVRAQVTADVDFSQSERLAETYKPNQGPETSAAVRSSQSSESSQPTANSASGIPGALSNQPPKPPAAPINGPAPALNASNAAATPSAATRRDAVTNFEIDKDVVHTRTGSGQIRRLTAAVVVNHRLVAGADGSVNAQPIAAAEMQKLEALVREAMGFSAPRGDSLNVVNAAFSHNGRPVASEAPWWERSEFVTLAKEVGKALLFLLLALLVVFGILRPAMRAANQKKLEAETPALAAAGPSAALEAEPVDALPLPSSAEMRATPLEEVRRIAREDPATVANVVRAWVNNNDQS